MLSIILAGIGWLAAPATTFTDATGRVISEEGAPIPGARVCEILQGTGEHCVLTDEQGLYVLSRATHPKMVIQAKGFLPVTVDTAPLIQPVTLPTAAALLVTVVDASTGKAISSGRVMIDTPSGKRIGSEVPFNAAGVRISTLEPGLVFVRVQTKGYEPGGPTPIELAKGAERSIKVAVKRLPASSAPGGKP